MKKVGFISLLMILLVTMVSPGQGGTGDSESMNINNSLQSGQFKWKTGSAFLIPADRQNESCFSVKDPSIVYYGNRWHLFYSVRASERSHTIEYISFANFKEADKAKRYVLGCHSGYFCAPQVFYFTPQSKWYLICQAADDSWEPNYQPAYSCTSNIDDPNSWSKLTPLYGGKPANVNAWLDFWVICDQTNAYLFFSSLDGKMWRAQTSLTEFPRGWIEPVIALTGDIFEAGHTYYLKGLDKYLTLIEAQNGHGWRYYKAYTAERLDGQWEPLAANKDNAFASMMNVRQTSEHWTDSISHGELIRDGFSEKMKADPQKLRFLFQGVLDTDRRGKPYGEIPWQLGILEPDS